MIRTHHLLIIYYIFELSVGLRLSPLCLQRGVWQCTVCNSATYRITQHTIAPCCACFQVCVQGRHAGSLERTVVGGPTPQKSDNGADHGFFFFLHPGSLPPDPIITRLPLLTTYHTRLQTDPHLTDEALSVASNCLMSKRLHWISNPVFQTPKSGPFGQDIPAYLPNMIIKNTHKKTSECQKFPTLESLCR